MKVSTTLILAIGAAMLLFEVAVFLRERLTYPYRIDDIGIPWALMIVAAAGIILAVGLAKLAFDRSLAKRRRISDSRFYLREPKPMLPRPIFVHEIS